MCHCKNLQILQNSARAYSAMAPSQGVWVPFTADTILNCGRFACFTVQLESFNGSVIPNKIFFDHWQQVAVYLGTVNRDSSLVVPFHSLHQSWTSDWCHLTKATQMPALWYYIVLTKSTLGTNVSYYKGGPPASSHLRRSQNKKKRRPLPPDHSYEHMCFTPSSRLGIYQNFPPARTSWPSQVVQYRVTRIPSTGKFRVVG